MNRPTDDLAAVATDLSTEGGASACLQSGDNIAQVDLPPLMTSGYAAELIGNLQTMRGRPIALDASSVQKAGALCLQVLLSARKTWKADGQPFCMTGVSEEMASRWQLFGLPLGESVECGA